MASYQNFIATISNALVFDLTSQDGRFVRLRDRTITVNGVLQNRTLLSLSNEFSQRATLVLKAFPNTDNFNLFVETRNNQSTQEFPINIIRDEISGAQFLQVDINSTGTPLRIDPDVGSGAVVQFVEFRVAGPEPTPVIAVDEFEFLRVGGGFSVPKFGFEAILPNINAFTRQNWIQIVPFILNGQTVLNVIARIPTAEQAAFLIAGGIFVAVVPFAAPALGIVLIIAELERRRQTGDVDANIIISNSTNPLL